MTENKKPIWKRWYMIVLYCFIALSIIGSFLPDSGTNTNNSGTGNVVKTICNTPYIQVGTECCLDQNSNNICDKDEQPTQQENTNSQNIQTTTPTQTSTLAVEEKSDGATMGEKNALSQALSYLRAMPFSYNGLIEQLEYEGYSHQEAVYGVDNCGANWNEQAALKAQSYLDVMPFSRDGLIDQLIYEGFTRSQAEYGVDAVGY